MKATLTSAIAIAIAITAAAVLAGCKQDRPAGGKETAMAQDFPVLTDPALLGKKLRLPAPVLDVRWIELPRSNPRGIGPTDTRLIAAVRFAPADSAAWMIALGGPVGRSGFHLDPAAADSLLGAPAAAECDLDSSGRNIPGPYYNPDGLATSWYQGVAAARLGGTWILEFVSR